ncbi:MAG TPA: hypothetical protein VNX29_16095 [Kaistia sp.]|nr:hypothetical protein [Kaistia sp.]
MPPADPVAWFGHVARIYEDSSVRVGWLLAEPLLQQPPGRAGSYRWMAGELGISARTVSRIVQRFEVAGLLRIRSGIGRGNAQRYWLQFPKPNGTSEARDG